MSAQTAAEDPPSEFSSKQMIAGLLFGGFWGVMIGLFGSFLLAYFGMIGMAIVFTPPS